MAKLIPEFAFVFAAYAFSVRQQKVKPVEPLSRPQVAPLRSVKPLERIVRDGVIRLTSRE